VTTTAGAAETRQQKQS